MSTVPQCPKCRRQTLYHSEMFPLYSPITDIIDGRYVADFENSEYGDSGQDDEIICMSCDWYQIGSAIDAATAAKLKR